MCVFLGGGLHLFPADAKTMMVMSDDSEIWKSDCWKKPMKIQLFWDCNSTR